MPQVWLYTRNCLVYGVAGWAAAGAALSGGAWKLRQRHALVFTRGRLGLVMGRNGVSCPVRHGAPGSMVALRQAAYDQ